MLLKVRSVTQTNILMGIRHLRFLWHDKIVLSVRFSFFVMKAHLNYGYMRKIHKQRNINCEKYVRTKYWDLEYVILLEESRILIMIGIRNLNANDIPNPRPGIQNTKVSWIIFYGASCFW